MTVRGHFQEKNVDGLTEKRKFEKLCKGLYRSETQTSKQVAENQHPEAFPDYLHVLCRWRILAERSNPENCAAFEKDISPRLEQRSQASEPTKHRGQSMFVKVTGGNMEAKASYE